MRIAICISGGLRTFKTAAPLMFEHLIDPLRAKAQVDLYFFGYSNIDGIEQNKEDIEKIYAPYKYVVRDWDGTPEEEIKSYFTAEEYEQMQRVYHGRWGLLANLSQMYNIKKVFELMDTVENDEGFIYDLAIRTRPDCYYFRPLTDDQIEKACAGYTLIPNEWDFKEVRPYAMSDAFAMSTSKEMKKYSKIFDDVVQYVEETNFFHVESLTGYYISSRIKLNRIEVPFDKDWFRFEYPPGASVTTINRRTFGT